MNGASLKPISQQNRNQDSLNENIFKGYRAGPSKNWYVHKEWIMHQPDPEQLYYDYFHALYPGRDVRLMAREVVFATSPYEFNNIVGRYVLKWYKETDNWESLVIIDLVKEKIVNISDVNDLTMIPDIKFDWKSERGNDTQAIADGYVNIKI